MKLLKTLNYALLINACCGVGYIATQLVWNWKMPSLLITIESIVSMALFILLVKFERKFNNKE